MKESGFTLQELLGIEHPIIVAPMFLVSNVEMVKAVMEKNVAGCIPALNYRTIPVLYGERVTKSVITLLVLIALNPVYLLWGYPEIGAMKYYFYLVFISFFIFLVLLWKK